MEAAIVQVHIAHFKFVHEMTSYLISALFLVPVGAGHARPAARTASTRFPYTCGPHICGPYMRGAGEGAAGRKVPRAVKTAPYKAPVNGES